MHFIWCRFYEIDSSSTARLSYIMGVLVEGTLADFLETLCDAAEMHQLTVHGVDVLCAGFGFMMLTESVFKEHVADRGDAWSFPTALVFCHRRLQRAPRCIGASAG